MSSILRQKALSGAKWSSISKIGEYGISFFVSIILARLLEPKEFGLIGMLTIFTVIAKVFINSGFTATIVRLKNATEKDYSTMFIFNMLVSLLLYLLMFFFAPSIAKFYKQPELISLTRWVSLIFLMNAFGLIQNARLIKQINFKTQTICRLAGLLVSAVISIYMAFNNYGVWSIVGQLLSQTLVTNISLWISSKWYPTKGFSYHSFKKLWGVGSKYLLTTLISNTIDNIDSIIIGKIFSATQLGFYTRAKNTKNIPQNFLAGISGPVIFSVLSNVNDDQNKLKQLHLQFFKLGIYIFFPVMFGLLSMAKPLIIVIYTSKWLPSIDIMQIICLSLLPYLLGVLFGQTIMALGESNLYLKLNSLKKGISLISLPIALIFGFYPFLIGVVILGYVGLLLDFYYVGKKLKIKITEYLLLFINPLALSFLMGIIVFMLSYIVFSGLFFQLITQIILAIVFYWFGSYILKLEEYFYLLDIIRDKLKLKTAKKS